MWLSANEQVLRLCRSFVNNSSTHIKSLNNQLSKIVELGESLGRLLGQLLKSCLLLMENVLKPLAKILLMLFGLTTAVSATDVAI